MKMELYQTDNLKFDGEKLIALVRANECIYNAMDTRHRNREFVNQAWSNIAAEMGISERLCREKWTNMRSNYKRELRKLRDRQREEGDSKVRVTWPYFKHMTFLLPHFSERSSDPVLQDLGEHFNFSDVVVTEDNSSTIDEHLLGDAETSRDASTLAITYPKKRKTTANYSDPEFSYLPTPSGICSTYLGEEEDDNKHFLLSLLPSMRRLTDEDNMAFRIEVQKLMKKMLYSPESAKDS